MRARLPDSGFPRVISIANIFAVGTAAEQSRQWTITTMRSPQGILEALDVFDIRGNQRRLVEGH